MTAGSPSRAFVGLGGNEGEVGLVLAKAVLAIDALPHTRVRRQSKVYRTPAWGRTEQPDFFNAVVVLDTRLAPRDLLEHLLAIEAGFGRVRSPVDRWGPRTLDLDLLMYDEQTLDEPGLHLPHPHLHERAFVLAPLLDVAPELVLPGYGRIVDLLAALDTHGIEALA